MSQPVSQKRLITRLLLLVVAMFAFGFVLVPLYDVMCKAFGINGKTGDQHQGTQVIDNTRQVKVQFVSSNAADMVWAFYPTNAQLEVHPGAINEMIFIAQNPTDRPMKAQAVPSISPGQAAAYFHKTECFCFTQQVLQPGERIEMPVRFIVDRDLPTEVKSLTLAYTLFDITDRQKPAVPTVKRLERAVVEGHMTLLPGWTFLFFQVEAYIHAYQELEPEWTSGAIVMMQ
ncbi:cytochrome c oxidase assembly protein [Pseudomonas sp. DOAB1067]|uniref:Cytochrome c oxidase assembly protein CtaG n=1 Tax=Pseudomonas triticifolii TaxID=2762592 RepID=A0ABR7BLF8_9PSED|nr:cytochrome c oxidase assembly protein [Pseudomonas triticifolii]